MDLSLLGFGAVKELFNIHPMFVHFPVALLPAAFLLFGLGILLKKPQLNFAGRACLYLGTAGALAALATGLLAEGSIPHNNTIHAMMQTHKAVAWAALLLSGALSAWSFFNTDHRPKGAWAFLALLALANLAGMQAADIGARLVYLEGAAVKPAVAAITGEAKESPASSPRPAAQEGAGLAPAGKAKPAGHEGHQHKH